MHSEHIPSPTRRQAPKSYSPKQRKFLSRHVSDLDGLSKRETLTGGDVFVRRGHSDPFPGRTNADLFRSVGASALRSGSTMTVEDEKLYRCVKLRAWGRIELETFRFTYQPTWFAPWLKKVIRDSMPDKRVSRSMAEFAWGFFAAERSEAMTMVTYEEFAAHYGVARSTVGLWLQVLRQAKVVESAHTWAEDNGKTSRRRPLGHKHPRCYATNLYRLGAAVADEVRIAIREGRPDARFCSGKTMGPAARNCGRILRAEMREESKARRGLLWDRRNNRGSEPPAASNCSPILGPLRPSVPSGSITPPRNGAASEEKARPTAVETMASPSRPTDRVTPCDAEARPERTASGRKGEHDAKRASTLPAKKKTSSTRTRETSGHRDGNFEARFEELVQTGLAHFRRGLHVVFAVLLLSSTACSHWIAHATHKRQQSQEFGGSGAPAGPSRVARHTQRDRAIRSRAFAWRPDIGRATGPRASSSGRGYATVDRNGDSSKAQSHTGPPVGRKAKTMTETQENQENQEPQDPAANETEPQNDAEQPGQFPSRAIPTVDGTVDKQAGKTILAAITTTSGAYIRWQLEHKYVVRLTRICGYTPDKKRVNARITGISDGGTLRRNVSGRVGPGELLVGLSSIQAESMTIAIECTELPA